MPVLLADPSITCTARDPDPCGKLARFVVSRSDGDLLYGAGGGTEEACEAHLADAVTGMIGGDENVDAVVAIRWDDRGTTP
jgi:hypothetical protein